MKTLIPPNIQPYSIPESELFAADLRSKLYLQLQQLQVAESENDQLKNTVKKIKQQKIHDQNQVQQVQPMLEQYSDFSQNYQRLLNLTENRKFISIHAKQRQEKAMEHSVNNFKDKIERRLKIAEEENENLHLRSKSLQIKESQINRLKSDMEQIRDSRKKLEIQKSIYQEGIQNVSSQFRIIRILKALQIITEINSNKDVFRESFTKERGSEKKLDQDGSKEHLSTLTEQIFELQLVAGDLNNYGSENIGYKAMRSQEDFKKFMDIKKHFEDQYVEVQDYQLDVQEVERIFSLQQVESHSLQTHYEIKNERKQEKVKQMEDLEFLHRSLREYEGITDYLSLLDIAQRYQVPSNIIVQLKGKNIEIQTKVIRNLIKSHSKMFFIVKHELNNHYYQLQIALQQINKYTFQKYGKEIDNLIVESKLKPDSQPFSLKLWGSINQKSSKFKSQKTNSQKGQKGRYSSLSARASTAKATAARIQNPRVSSFINPAKNNLRFNKNNASEIKKQLEKTLPSTQQLKNKQFLQLTGLSQQSSSRLSSAITSRQQTTIEDNEDIDENQVYMIKSQVEELKQDLSKIQEQMDILIDQNLNPYKEWTSDEIQLNIQRADELMQRRWIMQMAKNNLKQKFAGKSNVQSSQETPKPCAIPHYRANSLNQSGNIHSFNRLNGNNQEQIQYDSKVKLFRKGFILQKFERQENEFQRRFKQKMKILN